MSDLQPTKLFGRAFNLVIGVPNDPSQQVQVDFNDSNSHGLDVTGFDIDFTVEKSLKPEPNKCDIRIYNLAENSRLALSRAKKLTVRLEAGYQNATSLLYLGEVRAAWTIRDGADFVTHIESGDGEKEIAQSRIQVTRGAKVPVSEALLAIAKTLGVGLGNVPQIAQSLQTKGISTINGAALVGNASSRLTDFCRSAGLEWSIQNGALQILNIGQVLNTTRSFLMSTDTGMLESPTVDNDGILHFVCEIIPGLVPGVLVTMDALFVKGGYRVERCTWHGETYGNDWQISCEARKY